MKLASAFKWISRIFGKLLCLLGLRQSCVYGWIAAVKKEEREKKEKKNPCSYVSRSKVYLL